MSKCHVFNTFSCFSIIASSAGLQSTAARAGSSTSLWSRREPTGPGLCPSDGVNMATEASLNTQDRNQFLSCLLFFCEDQHPKVCAICCDYSLTFFEKAMYFVGLVITSDSFATIDYYAVFSILKQIVTLFPWSLALYSVNNFSLISRNTEKL